MCRFAPPIFLAAGDPMLQAETADNLYGKLPPRDKGGCPMRRREFIAGLVGAAATWPIAARAQQPAMPVIGFLSSTSPDTYAPFLGAFYQGLNESGYVAGPERRHRIPLGGGSIRSIAGLAAELVQRQVGVICAISTPAALAAEKATSTIPIVFFIGGDPVNLALSQVSIVLVTTLRVSMSSRPNWRQSVSGYCAS